MAEDGTYAFTGEGSRRNVANLPNATTCRSWKTSFDLSCWIRILAILIVIVIPQLLSAAPLQSNAAELEGKVVVGYQGWFGCPGDAGVSGMMHWMDGNGPTVEMLPDLSELPKPDQCTLPGEKDRPTAAVYSGSNPDVIDMHFRWMEQYAIATAAVQRFVSVLRAQPRLAYFDHELREIRASAETHGRKFFIEYDLSGSTPADIDMIVADWDRLVQSGLTASPAYQQVRRRPLLGLWGLGFAGRPWTPQTASLLIDRMRGQGRSASLMVGVPSGWRTSRGDSSPDPAWLTVWPKVDILSPWTVGRFSDDAGAIKYAQDVMSPDAEWAQNAGVIYLPTAFPGFSWSNLHHGSSPRNAIPRRCGAFLRTQFNNIQAIGLQTVFVAMFDEVDEGTAVYKTLPHRPEGDFLALDADGCDLPSDYYLKLLRDEAAQLRQRQAGTVSTKP